MYTTVDKYSIKYYEIFTVTSGPRIPCPLIKNLRFETDGKLAEPFLKKKSFSWPRHARHYL